ncbi:MAG TPA: triose-phosphate isomerase [Pseudomonadales bacterium]|nr:triose-phosphate isomerase [Pseudomonadales bacterium]
MRRPLVIGNWKMHGSLQSVTALLNALRHDLQNNTAVDVAVCAPFVHLPLCRELLTISGIHWGAQNVSEYVQGAYTGEISADMLADLDCRYVIVGHSERRALFGDTDSVVVAKLKQALAAGLTPVLCVGETLAEREGNITEAVIARQLHAVLDALEPEQLRGIVVAYEPVWAIGTGKTASPEQAQAVHAYIRTLWAVQQPEQAAALIVLYGGSVKADNARLLFAQPDVDGGLVGGAALDQNQFCAIVNAAEQAWNH